MGVDFGGLRVQLRPRIRGYLEYLLGAEDAELVTEELLSGLSQNLADSRDDAALATACYRIATVAALDRLRRVSSASEVDAPEAGNIGALGAPASAERPVLSATMIKCARPFVARLAPSSRAIIVLSEIEGFADTEIATILGIDLASVAPLLHRARSELRAELAAGCKFYREQGGNERACEQRPPARATVTFARSVASV